MNNKLVLIEGFEATGKTSISNHLTKIMDAKYIHAPQGLTNFTEDLYQHIIKRYTRIDNDAKMLIFLAGHMEVIKQANRLKVIGNLVCDRSLLSTLVYQGMEFKPFMNVLMAVGMPRLEYDSAIVLTADVDTVTDRLQRRGKLDTLDDYFILNLQRIVDSYHLNAPILYPDAHIIDTSNMSLAQVEDLVIAKVEEDLCNSN